MTSPQDSRAAGWEAFYRDLAAAGPEAMEHRLTPHPWFVERLASIRAEHGAAGRADGGRALDLACGSGRHALALAGGGWETTAIDVSAAAIGLLEASARERGLTLHTAVTDLASPAGLEEIAANGPFDVVLDSFFHLTETVAAAARLLAPGGHLLVGLHAPESPHGPPPEIRGSVEDLLERLGDGFTAVARDRRAHGPAHGDAHGDAHGPDDIHDLADIVRRAPASS